MSWLLMSDEKYHYQWNGEMFCDYVGYYVLCEESNPPKRQRCKNCMKKHKLMIVQPKTSFGRFLDLVRSL